jgi:hypothetical protein
MLFCVVFSWLLFVFSFFFCVAIFGVSPFFIYFLSGNFKLFLRIYKLECILLLNAFSSIKVFLFYIFTFP